MHQTTSTMVEHWQKLSSDYALIFPVKVILIMIMMIISSSRDKRLKMIVAAMIATGFHSVLSFRCF